MGDLSFLHDQNGLILGPREPRPDLCLVVVNNDGGGIFSFLPQAGALPADRFEQLFGTPHGVDLAALVAVHGVPTTGWDGLAEAVAAGPGVRMVLARTGRAANVAVHDELNRAIARAL
jgi:2-succinyl-5-enolpyruvyl-6-hydroxy-3-cyclohexene-1-carboxylate synthase